MLASPSKSESARSASLASTDAAAEEGLAFVLLVALTPVLEVGWANVDVDVDAEGGR